NEFLAIVPIDATTVGSIGNNLLVQINFGTSFGGSLLGNDKKTFFFLNYEGLRLVQANAQTLTVPTPDEIQGDFSMSKAQIYDPTTAVANPNYDPTQPTGPNNFPYTRSQFQDNKIPLDRINPQLEAFLMQHLPMPNMMMDNSGVDSNNYLDIRNENHSKEPGTVSVDQIFKKNDIV